MNTTPEENISFESMPDFGGLFSTSRKKEVVDDTVYKSLYEELAKKCHPNNFLGEPFDKKRFDTANMLYSELKAKQGCSDSELITLRNRAISELGIHISTKKLYDYLMMYIDPQIYTSIEPYDYNRVSKAGDYYNRLIMVKDDILALEKLEKDADGFINQRKQELIDAEYKKREEKKRIEQEKKQSKNVLSYDPTKDKEREYGEKEGVDYGITAFIFVVVVFALFLGLVVLIVLGL